MEYGTLSTEQQSSFEAKPNQAMHGEFQRLPYLFDLQNARRTRGLPCPKGCFASRRSLKVKRFEVIWKSGHSTVRAKWFSTEIDKFEAELWGPAGFWQHPFEHGFLARVWPLCKRFLFGDSLVFLTNTYKYVMFGPEKMIFVLKNQLIKAGTHLDLVCCRFLGLAGWFYLQVLIPIIGFIATRPQAKGFTKA